jgi:deazaflavin-dependent oxidoreductase (nitroreductase family)
MQVPRSVVRFNNAVNNPVQGQYAWLVPPWTVIVHRGRKSGRTYRTPVVGFRKGRTLAVTILYGEESDWVRNVLGGSGLAVRGGRTYPLLDPRVAQVDETSELSRAGRRYGRLSGQVLLAELGEPEPGFGRGPRRTR